MKLRKLFALCALFFVAKTFAQPCNFTITPPPGGWAYYSSCSTSLAALSANPAKVFATKNKAHNANNFLNFMFVILQ